MNNIIEHRAFEEHLPMVNNGNPETTCGALLLRLDTRLVETSRNLFESRYHHTDSNRRGTSILGPIIFNTDLWPENNWRAQNRFTLNDAKGSAQLKECVPITPTWRLHVGSQCY